MNPTDNKDEQRPQPVQLSEAANRMGLQIAWTVFFLMATVVIVLMLKA